MPPSIEEAPILCACLRELHRSCILENSLYYLGVTPEAAPAAACFQLLGFISYFALLASPTAWFSISILIMLLRQQKNVPYAVLPFLILISFSQEFPQLLIHSRLSPVAEMSSNEWLPIKQHFDSCATKRWLWYRLSDFTDGRYSGIIAPFIASFALYQTNWLPLYCRVSIGLIRRYATKMSKTFDISSRCKRLYEEYCSLT